MRILALTNFLFTFVLSLCSATTLTDEEIAKILSDTSRPEIPLSNLRDYEHSQQLGNLRDKLRTLDLDIDDRDGGDIFPNEAPDVLEGGAFDSINMIDRDGKERRYGHGLMNNQRLGFQPIENVPLVVYNEEGRKIRTDSSSLGYSKRRAGWHNKGRYSGISIARRGTGGRPTRDDIRRDPSPWIPLGYLVTSTPTYGRDLAQRPSQGPNYFPDSEGNGNAMEKRWGQKGRFKSIKMQRRDDAGGRGLGLDEPSTGGLDVDYLESSMVGNEYYPFGAYSPLEDTWYGPKEADVRPIRHVRPKRAVDDQMDQYNTKRIDKRAATNRRGSGFGRAQSQTRWKRADIGEFLNTPNQADEEGRSWNNAGGFGRNNRRSMNVLRAILLRNSSCYIYNTCGYEINNNGVRPLGIYPPALRPYVPVTRGLGYDVMSRIFTRLAGHPGYNRQQYRHGDPGNSRWLMLPPDEVEPVLSRNRGTGLINNGHFPDNNRLNGVNIGSNDISYLSDDAMFDLSDSSLTKRNLFCNRRTGCGRKRGKRDRLPSDQKGGICSRLKCDAKRVLCNRNGCRAKRVGSMITRLYCRNFICSTVSYGSVSKPLDTPATVVQKENKNSITDPKATGPFQQVDLSNGDQPEKYKVEPDGINPYAKHVLYDIIINSLVRHKSMDGDGKFENII